jgi:tetratricopeptide (TPR) repeat protein
MIDEIVRRDPALSSRHLRNRLRDGTETPGSMQVSGAVLLSDIVGFTTHVEAMAALGRHGVETFSVAMGGYIDRSINLVHAAGGDVLAIAGDSLLCLWESDGTHDGTAAALRRAVRTGLSIQSALHRHPIDDQRIVETRIGVSAGALSLTVVGGAHDEWELLTHGDAVSRVDHAERMSAPGAVTVAQIEARMLDGCADVVPTGTEWFQVVAIDPERHGRSLESSALAPPSATELVSSEPPASPSELWNMEFRRLSIAMVRVPELASASPVTTQRIFRLFQDIVHDREGTTSVVNDNKGARFLAIFGAPPRAHEDDPTRAVGAIRAFSSAAGREGASCSAGIATGRALFGTAGNAIRRATMLAGDVINVAARLSTTADRVVLCDQDTAVGAQSRYAFTVMNPIMVKGKAAPMPVFEPTPAVPMGRSRSVAVRGRRAELVRVGRVLDVDGPADVIVVGDAGLGKSTLLTSFAEIAAERGQPFLAAATDAIDRRTPYLAWIPAIMSVLRDVADLVSNEPPAVVSAVRQLLDDDLAAYAPLIGPLFGETAPHHLGVPEEARAALIARIVAAVLTASEPSVIVLEDVQWADTGSLAVIRELRELEHRPRLVLSTRLEGLSALRAIVDRPDVDVVELTPIADDAVRAIIVDRLGTEHVPRDLVEFVTRRVAGHPYFCEQLLTNLIETGAVIVNGPEVVVGTFDSAMVPSTVEGVIVSRFDRLAPAAQRCLKAASVVGHRHTLAAVQACLDGIDVPPVYDAIGDDGLVVHVGDSAYEFQHVIARDVVYGLMTDHQRRGLHRAVAGYLESNPWTAGPATIGRHWRSAGDVVRATAYIERAASEALEAGSFMETLALLDEAAELRGGAAIDADPGALIANALQRARASYYVGLHDDARRELEVVIGELDDPLPTTADAHIGEHRAIEDRRAARRTATADPASPDQQDQLVLFDAYRQLVKVLYLLGETGLPILTASLRGLDLAERLGRSLEGAAMQALVSGAYALVGDVDRFESHAAEAIAVAESPEGLAVANHVWRMIAVARATRGRWDASIDASDRALAALDPEGRNRDSGIWQTRAAVHLCAGDFIRAETAWRRTADIAARDGNARLGRWSKLDEAQTLLGRDLVAEADAALTASVVAYGPPSDPLGTIEHHYTTALLRGAQDRHAEALRAARQVIGMVDGVPPSGFHWVEFCAGALESMVSVLYAADRSGIDRGVVVAEIEHGLGLLDGFAGRFPHVGPRSVLIAGLVANALGRDDAADRLLAEGIERAYREEFVHEAARGVVIRARLGLTVAEPDLRRARDELAGLGANRWMHRAEHLLEVGGRR